MNEFIVWDEEKKAFNKNEVWMDRFGAFYTLPELSYSETKGKFWDRHSMKTFNYIGKTDINENKIYADCSIVEIEYGLYSTRRTIVGYFSYNSSFCRYDFIGNESNFNFTLINSIKIIDTIQENKLGLIKGS